MKYNTPPTGVHNHGPQEGPGTYCTEFIIGACKLYEDDPELDATDGAHPAWWRGSDHSWNKAQDLYLAHQKALEKLIEVGCWVYDFNNYNSKETDTCFYCAASHSTSVDERDRKHNPNCAYVIAKDIVDNPFRKGANK